MDEAPSRLRGVRLPGREGTWDVVLSGGRVAQVEPSGEPPGEPRERAARPAAEPGPEGPGPRLLCLPAFREPHLHADRAYLRSPRPPSDFADALRMTVELRREVPAADVARRARRVLERAAAHGAVHVRTHVDVDDVVEERSLEGVLAAREELRDRLEVEVVAFATSRNDPARPDARARLAEALDRGADLLGGAVHLYPDPRAATEALLDLAAERGVAVDVHVDEALDAPTLWVGQVARAAVERGLAGRLTVSHACLLSTRPQPEATAAIEALLAARATVVILPATNLYLQDRGPGTPRRRGLTLVRELLAAGVPVRFGSDNVGDAFFPFGDADPLEAAFLAALAAHLDDEGQLLAGIAGGASEVRPGMEADLVLLPAASVTEALAVRPAPRTVLRKGAVVAAPVADSGAGRP